MGNIDQKRIAKNTLMLYIRMGILMLVNFYTSRVVLDSLGEVDNGLYGTVAGIVMMFAFMNSTMATACQRFFAIEMGRDRNEELKRIFSLCVIVFFAIAIIVVILSETAGLWLLFKKINNDGRFHAALVVFQCSIISFLFKIIMTPYQGMVVIKEKMKVYSYISVFEAFGNLAIAIAISRSEQDRLILYGILMMAVNIAVTLYYIVYCSAFWSECRFKFYWNKEKFMEIFSFAGWNMIGPLTNTCKTQGITILINIFFGNAVVSARTMSQKVFTSVQQFSENFIIALKPQMIKSYSAGDKASMFKLMFQGSKFSYFLLFVVSFPLMLETAPVLDFWLKDVPEYTVMFTRLVLLNALIDVFAAPLATTMQAYGNIRNYQLICGPFLLLILPVSWILFKLGFAVQSIFYVSIVICALAIPLRLLIIRHYLNLNLSDYLKYTVIPVLSVTAVSVPIPLAMEMLMEPSLFKFFAVVGVSIICVAGAAYGLGMTKTERKHLNEQIMNKIKRHS